MIEIIELIARRDGISYNEAHNIVDECLDELREAIGNGCSYEEGCDIIAGWLGLEPDYFDMLMWEI